MYHWFLICEYKPFQKYNLTVEKERILKSVKLDWFFREIKP